MTNILELKLIERTCKCGCGLKFKTKWGSKQEYRSEDCRKLHGPKRPKNHTWKSDMNYMVRG